MDQGEQVGATNGESVSDDDAGWREARTIYLREDQEARAVVQVFDGYALVIVQVRTARGGRVVPQEAQEAPQAQEGLQVRTANR